jgi:ribosome-binding ATPase YchF (GTP1/OBG family)
MKLSLFSIPDIKPGKQNVKDTRLDEVDKITKAKKKTYIQVELCGEDAARDSDAILTLKSFKSDLILKDLEFVETRFSRAADDQEKAVLTKLKNILEKEEFVFNAGLSESEKQSIGGYGLLTAKPVILAEESELADLGSLLFRALKESGYISFFTTGEKETRAWLIKKGINAWEAAGAIHSDIQRGFIRAEIISFQDFIQSGGETQAKQAGKQRLEQKEYVMQDTDLANFRFNK